jgi:MEMO1 family protein
MIREPIVSGQFYPDRKNKLLETINAFDEKSSQKFQAKGLILPHAGYFYSGKVATVTVSKVISKQKIIILGPNHTGLGERFGLWAKGLWRTPLADAPIDEGLAESILKGSSYIKEDYLCHINEHSIEVELPILQRFFDKFSFVPISCQYGQLDEYKALAKELACTLKYLENDILIVASSDLTHYEPEQTARRKDRLVMEAIVNLDEEQLLKVVSENNISMCGTAPVAIAISCLKQIGAHKAQVVLYETSAQASGDASSVVGYTGVIIS